MTFDLSAALEALRGRMQTNPSEFFANTYKWDFLWREGTKEVLTEDELKLLAEGAAYVRRAEINNSILHALLEEPESKQEYESVRYGPSTTTAVNMGMQGALQGTTTGFGQAVMKSQMEQLKYDMARQQNQQQYGSAPAPWQNTPSQYLKSFFK